MNGITAWVHRWKARGWTKATGEDVVNKDLWVMLLHLVNKQAHAGCEVRFWHISRTRNTQADHRAQVGADLSEEEDYRARDLVRTEAKSARRA